MGYMSIEIYDPIEQFIIIIFGVVPIIKSIIRKFSCDKFGFSLTLMNYVLLNF